MRRLLPLALLLSIPIVLSACGGGGKPSTVSQQVPAAGATVSLGNDVTLQIPAGAVADATRVTITKGTGPGELAGGQSLSSAFNIDLGGQTLQKPVTLEIAFDPKKLPKGSSAETAFLAYYDEAKTTWVPLGGTVDASRNVVTIQTDHLSWWEFWTWNWGAWRVILDSILTANVTQFLESIVQSSKGCQPGGTTVTVDKTNAHDIIQGCVDRDDPQHPELRVINQRTFFVEERPSSGGNGYPESKVLGPGEELAFTASTADPAPLVVSVDLTQKAGVYLVIHLFIQMLPGFRELGISAPQISCIAEKLHDVSYVTAASEALVVSHDGAAAAEQLIKMLLDADAVRRFITGATDCSYAGARTWSVEGIQQIGSAVATIHSAVDFVVNYFRNNHSEVAFTWTQPPTPIPARAALPFDLNEYAGIIQKLQSAVDREDASLLDLLLRAWDGEPVLTIGGWGGCGAGALGAPMTKDNLDVILQGTHIRLLAVGKRDVCDRPAPAFGIITTGWRGKVLHSATTDDNPTPQDWTFKEDEALLVFWSQDFYIGGRMRGPLSFFGIYPSSSDVKQVGGLP